jgi:zinc/manganese transport system substrate-binding protein
MKKMLCALALTCLPLSGWAAKLPVVASFTIVADMAREIGGDRVEVVSLVGANQDSHVYQPTPADVKRLAGAKVFVVNGLGFEGWMSRLASASGFKGITAVATKGLTPIKDEGHGHGDEHGEINPHAWHDLGAVQKHYIKNIEMALKQADPAGKSYYQQRAADYSRRVKELDDWALKAFAGVPVAKRKVLTTHDAFPYFGKRYGLTFLAPQGSSTESEASAKTVAKLVTLIRKEKVTAVFFENMSDKRMLNQLSKEAGVQVIGEVYPDALSKSNEPAANFLALFRSNAEAILKALK